MAAGAGCRGQAFGCLGVDALLLDDCIEDVREARAVTPPDYR
jgi:hypothetical protein